ncbi:acyl transferase/acyl hydrolase/lysophospholipase [Flagelloscypha sp. PMI_526]|nr:acyl transferase/acyl hydrolase/lysophospholipase [Flagelloscypha sp. PMI_526]
MQSDGVRILCCDNGGTRALTQLVMLQELLNCPHGAQRDGRLAIRPSDAFDLITGSGLGAVIATMLGHLQMTIGEAIDAYTKLLPAFSDTNWWAQDRLKWNNLLPHLYTLAESHSPHNALSSQSPPATTRKTNVMIAVSSGPGTRPHLLRNYSHDDSLAPNFDFVEVCRAACATPGYFGPIKTGLVREAGEVYGAQGLPNIIFETMTEAAAAYPTRPIACVISLGTGMTVQNGDGPRRPWFFFLRSQKDLLRYSSRDIAISAEDIAERFYTRYQKRMKENVYFRFNVEQGMQDILIETPDNFSAVVYHARRYMQRALVRQNLNSAAQALSRRTKLVAPYVGCPTPPELGSRDEKFSDENVKRFLKICLEVSELLYNNFSRIFAAYQQPESRLVFSQSFRVILLSPLQQHCASSIPRRSLYCIAR